MGVVDVVSNLNQSQLEKVSLITWEYLQLAEIIWEYMLMRNTMEKSELILVLGNNDIRVAQHAAQLWLDGYAQYIMFSGDLGNLTEGTWTSPEYAVFRDVALKMGVPSNRILVEKCAKNTGENVRFSYDVLKSIDLVPHRSIILVQAPYMERRTYATFMKQWPEMNANLRVQVTSPAISLRDYPNESVGTLQHIIGVMLGCLQRIIVYPAKGYHIPQEIPNDVKHAYNMLTECKLFSNFMVNS